jgi:hypothetical protein
MPQLRFYAHALADIAQAHQDASVRSPNSRYEISSKTTCKDVSDSIPMVSIDPKLCMNRRVKTIDLIPKRDTSQDVVRLVLHADQSVSL